MKKAVPKMAVYASAPTYLRQYADLFAAGAVEQGLCDGMLFGRMAFADPDFANLIRTSSNTYTFNQGGYDPYVYANLSVTKEIGRAVSLSLYANNFTFSRKAVESYSTGVSAVFVPNFYYGLSCRVKF